MNDNFNGIPVTIDDRPFDGWAFQPLAIDPEAFMKALPDLVASAYLDKPLTRPEERAVEPLPSTEPQGALLDHQAHSVMLLLGPQADKNELIAVWPGVQPGTEVRSEIQSMTLAPERLRAMLTVDLDEDQSLCFFDQRFAVTRGAYRVGRALTFAVGGTAWSASPAPAEPFFIKPDDPAYAQLIERGVKPLADGRIQFETKGLAGLLRREDIAPNVYEFRGTVVAERPSYSTVFGQALRRFEIVVARLGPDDREFALTIAFPTAVAPDPTWPRIGDDVMGIISVDGRFWAAPDVLDQP